VSRYSAIPVLVALSPGHSDIRRFLPLSPARQEIIRIVRKKFRNLLRQLAPLTFLIHVQAFRDPLRGELPHVQIFVNDGTNLVKWDAQVLSYWFSRNPEVFLDYLVNLINNLRGGQILSRPGPGAKHVEKLPRLNWATQFLTVAYDGAFSPNVSLRMAWISFGTLPCRGKKCWQLASRCFWNRVRSLTCVISASVTRKDLQIGTWTGPSFQRHYRLCPTISGRRSANDLLPSTHITYSYYCEIWHPQKNIYIYVCLCVCVCVCVLRFQLILSLCTQSLIKV